MLTNILKSTLRSLLKNKRTFIINVLALAIGLGSCIIAYLHISYEMSYDQYHSNKDQIFRLVTGDVKNGEGWVKVAAPIPVKITSEVPEVQNYTRLTKFSYNDKVSVIYGDKVFNEELFYLADESIFSMFDFKWVNGRSVSDLAANSVVISSTVANKYFDEDPIGKIIKVDGRMNFQVAGVFESIPQNSHLKIDFIVSFQNLETVLPNTSLNGNWGQFNYFTYLLVQDGANPIRVESKIRELVAEFGEGQSMRFENLALQPLVDIHFQPNRGNDFPSYDTKYLFIYGAIALAILIISLINFINLSVASSTTRIKEVGVRKVMGASRNQLIGHFVAESIITTLIATLIGLLVADFSKPYINNLLDTTISISLNDTLLFIGLIFLIVFIALISGGYISLFILSFNPVNAVKGVIKIGNKGKRFKDLLMTIQFATSCILILSAFFVYQQLNLLKNKDIGLDEEQIVTLQIFDEFSQEKIDALLKELANISGVQSVSASNFTPGSTNWHQTVLWDGQTEDVNWNLIIVDENFIDTYGLELTEGNITSLKNLSNAKVKYVVNEAAVKEAGWPNGLGQTITAFGKDSYAPITAVVKDFNYKSLHNLVEPCVLVIRDKEKYSQVSIRVASTTHSEVLREIETVYSAFLSTTPLELVFAKDQFNNLYKVEGKTGTLIGILTAIAILLALTGVYALLSFAIRERTKELAVRKVLGIRGKGIIMLLSGNYVKLLIIANIIGIPITWYLVDNWLNNFSYRIGINLLTFVLEVLLTFLLVFLIVGLKVFQVERINPTEALRNE